MLSFFCVHSIVLAPVRADAAAASHPAWPPPTTTTVAAGCEGVCARSAPVSPKIRLATVEASVFDTNARIPLDEKPRAACAVALPRAGHIAMAVRRHTSARDVSHRAVGRSAAAGLDCFVKIPAKRNLSSSSCTHKLSRDRLGALWVANSRGMS